MELKDKIKYVVDNAFFFKAKPSMPNSSDKAVKYEGFFVGIDGRDNLWVVDMHGYMQSMRRDKVRFTYPIS